MSDGTGTKLVTVVAPSPMPVLLTNPSPDSRFDFQTTVRVNPGLIRLGSKQNRLKEVVWLNETGDDVAFTFESSGAALFFDLTSTGPGPFTVKNNKDLKLKIAKNAPENSIFSYQVDCKATPGRLAQGNSAPEISCP
jgi:hypothetical protein